MPIHQKVFEKKKLTRKSSTLRTLGKGTADLFKSFCSSSHGPDFELFDKVHAKGNTTEPFTRHTQKEPPKNLELNFEKFLVGKDGKIITRCKIGVTTDDLKAPIEAALDA